MNAIKQAASRETVLLVEDEDIVRKLTHKILTRLGYQVLVACNGYDAFAQYQNHAEPIDLLLTDMVMPRMNGRDLYIKLKEQHPDLKVLFMSGYNESILAQQDSVAANFFIQKPFSYESLALKVREAIEQPSNA